MPLAERELEYVRRLVRARSAIVIEPDKDHLIESRLEPLAVSRGYSSLFDMLVDLQRGGANGLCDRVVEAMTTNETSWFRDVHPFRSLQEQVLPSLIAARQTVKTLNIWSAACASGQEPYSILMTLREHFPELSTWHVRCIASDLSARMVGRAEAGIYSQLEVNRGLPAHLLVKYFVKDGASWQIDEQLRRMLEARVMNLLGDWTSLPAFDLVFLRNVLIYFDVDTRHRILESVRRVLRPDGFLFLGGAETTMNLHAGFERVDPSRSSCFRLRQP